LTDIATTPFCRDRTQTLVCKTLGLRPDTYVRGEVRIVLEEYRHPTIDIANVKPETDFWF